MQTSWRDFWRRPGKTNMALRHLVTWTLTSLNGWALSSSPLDEKKFLLKFHYFCYRWLETGGWRQLQSYSTKLPFSSFMSGRMWLYRLRDYFSLPCMNIHPKSLSHNACVSLAFGHDYHTFTHAPLSAPTGALVVMMCYYYISAAAGHFFEFSHCGLCLYQDLSMMVIEDGAPWICLDGLLQRRKIKFSASHRVWRGPASEDGSVHPSVIISFLKIF